MSISKLKKGTKVQVISGDKKGQLFTIEKVFTKEQYVFLDNLFFVSKKTNKNVFKKIHRSNVKVTQ